MKKTHNQIALSAIVVVGQRSDDLTQLANDYWRALEARDLPFELIFVLDGRKPDALEELMALRESGLDIKIVRLSRAFGESTALMSGFDIAEGDLVLTLPAYYQVDPAGFDTLFESLGDASMVVAKREPRRGSGFERLRRRVFHRLLNGITGMNFSDLGCGVRLMERRILEELRIYGDQHRFLAVLASHAGFRVKEVAVPQSDRDEFPSGYRPREYMHRLLDIFTVFFLIRFTKKPLRFFGMIGGLTLIVGGVILGVLVIQRLIFDVALADRPAMLLSSLLVVLGLQLFSLGLLGELIIFTHARSLKEYKVDMIVGGDGPEADTADAAHEKPAA